MIRTLVIFLPAFTCFLWALFHRLAVSRSDTAPHLLALLLFTGLFLFSECCYADVSTPYSLQIAAILVAQASLPCIVPLTIIYLRKLRGTPTSHPLQMLWIIAPAALLTSGILLYAVSSPDMVQTALSALYTGGFNAISSYRGTPVYLFFVSTFIVFRIIVACEVVWLLIYLLIYKRKGAFRFKTIWNFFFHKGAIQITQLQLFNVSLLFFVFLLRAPVVKDFVYSHPWIMAIMSFFVAALVYWFSYMAMFGSKRSLRLSEIGDGWRYNYGSATKDEVVGRMLDSLIDDAEDEALRRVQSRFGESVPVDEWHDSSKSASPAFTSLSERIFSAVSDSWDEERRLSALQKLMMEEQLFLQPRLTLGDVADKLDSNTSYVSRLVNNAYNLGFPEFINTLRIDYAEQYILNHREAKQDEIAAKCGFLSASSFNNTFKKITGMTPKVWAAGVSRVNKEQK